MILREDNSYPTWYKKYFKIYKLFIINYEFLLFKFIINYKLFLINKLLIIKKSLSSVPVCWNIMFSFKIDINNFITLYSSFNVLMRSAI